MKMPKIGSFSVAKNLLKRPDMNFYNTINLTVFSNIPRKVNQAELRVDGKQSSHLVAQDAKFLLPCK